jgi:hypothetical protein
VRRARRRAALAPPLRSAGLRGCQSGAVINHRSARHPRDRDRGARPLTVRLRKRPCYPLSIVLPLLISRRH